jgi:hypothetical protein
VHVGHRKRFYASFDNATFDEYLEIFEKPALEIESTVIERDGEEWHPIITCE